MSGRAAVEVTVGQNDMITNLFLAGHGLDYVCERGATGVLRWTRPVALEVARRHGWDLDPSGRVPRHQRPQPAPPARRASCRLPGPLEAIAQYAEQPRPATSTTVATSPPNAVPRGPMATPVVQPPARQPAVQPPATSAELQPKAAEVTEAVARFLADRIVAAPDDAFLTAPELRAAYESWRVREASPAASPRRFGVALSARYRKKQANKVINDTKPICYYGIAWKPATPLAEETPTEGTAPGTFGADAAGTAPEPSGSGHGYAGPDAQPQVSPSRSQSGEGGGLGASDAPAEPPATEAARFLAATVPAHAPEDWTWNPDTRGYELRDDEANADVLAELPGAGGPQSTPGTGSGEGDLPPVTSVGMRAPQVDLLAVGLAHPDPKIRAKATRVLAVVDDLCRALARRRT